MAYMQWHWRGAAAVLLCTVLCAHVISVAHAVAGSNGQCDVCTLDSGSAVNHETLVFSKPSHDFAMVADLDLKSRDPEHFRWKSFLKHGKLLWDKETDRYSVTFAEAVPLYSETARSNRSMELSELVKFKGRLLAMCDYTGLIYKIIDEKTDHPKVLQRWAVADGNGKSIKPFKMEWATRKDGELIVGSVGKEWVTQEKGFIHNDAEWIKVLTDEGKITNVDWSYVYQALRHATNTTYPGYLWHEAVTFVQRSRMWYFLPRKASENTPYDPTTDETLGTNLLIVASEDFKSIRVERVGQLEKDKGFTSLRHIPGTQERFIALKVMEIGDIAKTWFTVFDAHGNILLDPSYVLVSETEKYEGLDFL